MGGSRRGARAWRALSKPMAGKKWSDRVGFVSLAEVAG